MMRILLFAPVIATILVIGVGSIALGAGLIATVLWLFWQCLSAVL